MTATPSKRTTADIAKPAGQTGLSLIRGILQTAKSPKRVRNELNFRARPLKIGSRVWLVFGSRAFLVVGLEGNKVTIAARDGSELEVEEIVLTTTQTLPSRSGR